MVSCVSCYEKEVPTTYKAPVRQGAGGTLGGAGGTLVSCVSCYEKEVPISDFNLSIRAAAHDFHEKNGSWPCSDSDLNAPTAKQLISQRHWKIETNCRDKAAFVTYQENGKDSFRRISFVDGEGTGNNKN